MNFSFKTGLIIATASLLWLVLGCEKDKLSTPEPTVRVLISSSGLGDMSYNDNIFQGILQAQQENYFRLEYASPKDDKEAEQILRNWKEEGDDPRTDFTILAASEFEDLAQRTMPPTPVNNYLMFDTKADNFTIPVFHFTGYGVSFLAGIAAYAKVKTDKAVYLGGKQHGVFIEECYAGFNDGYIYAGGKEVIELYLHTIPKGFAMPKRAYQMADSLYRLYPFIYAMAGSSNNGIYEYLRDYPTAGYTAGVDTDQSAYSDRIIGSMIKETGRCIKSYITAWIKGEKIPMRKWHTLESGFMAFKIAGPYEQELKKVIEENLQTAIEKEGPRWLNNIIPAYQVADFFKRLSDKQYYRKLFLAMETCYSGQVGIACADKNIPGMLCLTAANRIETSKTSKTNASGSIWISNSFTDNLLEQLSTQGNTLSIYELYHKVYNHTIGSHASVYNSKNVNSLYTTPIREFIYP